MLTFLSLLDLVYMLRSTLAATLLEIIALPVPLLRQISGDPPGEWKTIVFFVFFEDEAGKLISWHAKTIVFIDFLVRWGWKTLRFLWFLQHFFRGFPKSAKDRFWEGLGTLWEPFGDLFWACWRVYGSSWASFGSKWSQKREDEGLLGSSRGGQGVSETLRVRFWNDFHDLVCAI